MISNNGSCFARTSARKGFSIINTRRYGHCSTFVSFCITSNTAYISDSTCINIYSAITIANRSTSIIADNTSYGLTITTCDNFSRHIAIFNNTCFCSLPTYHCSDRKRIFDWILTSSSKISTIAVNLNIFKNHILYVPLKSSNKS